MRLPAEAAQKEPNWDSYNGWPTSSEAIAAAEALMYWMPMADGGLMVESIVGDSEVSIEIAPDGQISCISWGRK